MEAARRFITRHLGPEIDATAGGESGANYKSHLQQVAQRQFGATPTYSLLDEKGPDHLKCFKIAAQIGPRRYAPAWGASKKDAEQRAAMNALSQLDGGPDPVRGRLSPCPCASPPCGLRPAPRKIHRGERHRRRRGRVVAPRRGPAAPLREGAMSGSLVANLGIGPETWLFLSLLSCLTLFFKFSRVWSIRNLDLLLLFALTPGMMVLVGAGRTQPWSAFLWLFLGSGLWLVRCLVDLGLSRRPLLEPNLNAAGLTFLGIGILGLMVAETVSLPVGDGATRNPADPAGKAGGRAAGPHEVPADLKPSIESVLKHTPLPASLRRSPPQVIVSRVLASLAHLGLVAGMLVVGWRHFGRPIIGLAVATCYLLMPYTRIALVDSGQLVPAALIVAAVAAYAHPGWAGALIGLAAGWMPACLGLIPLWTGFYWRRGALKFLAFALVVVATCGALGALIPGVAAWAQAMEARSPGEVGLIPNLDAPATSGFWAGIEPSFRLPVLIAYLALLLSTAFWPAEKDLGSLIALSAALLVASQFWYLGAGGTLVVLYLPLVLLMMFRTNLATKRPAPRPPREPRVHASAFPVR